MQRSRLVLILFVVLLSWLGWFIVPTSGKHAVFQLHPNSVVLAFGDSLTYGYGVNDAKESYPDVLSKMLGVTVINEGRNGRTTAEGLADLPEILAKTQPDFVILFLGGNDFLQRKPSEETEANLLAMVDLIQTESKALLLVATPSYQSLGVPSFYRSIAKTKGVALEDNTVLKLLKSPSMKSDAVRFNAMGYQKLAEGIAEKLKKEGVWMPSKTQ